YLLWPLLLTLGLRPRTSSSSTRPADRELPRSRVVLVAVTAALSFLLAEVLLRTNGPFAFYMLPTRAWELLVGALAAIAVARGRIGESSGRLAALAGLVGLAMIAATCIRLEGSDPFPGHLALAPPLGAALLLLAGHAAPNPVSRMLSAGPLVAIGLVSYSAYLWHWPLLAFHRYGYGKPGPVAGAVIVALTFAAAWASRRWIETPARRSTASPSRVFLRQFAMPAAVVCALVAGARTTAGFGPRVLSASFREHHAKLERAARESEDSSHSCNVKRITTKEMRSRRCVFGPEGAPVAVLLWGDSQAMHFVGMMEKFAAAGGFRFRQVDAWACPPIEGDPAPFARRVDDCRISAESVLAEVSEYPVVVLSALWPDYGPRPFVERSIALARKLAAAGHEVVILGRVPDFPAFDLRCDLKAQSFPFKSCGRDERRELPSWLRAVNARLRRFAEATPGVEYLDVNDVLCPDGGPCRAYDEAGRPRYFDHNHLSLEGSRGLGESILRSRGLPEPFRDVDAKARAWARAHPAPSAGPAPGAVAQTRDRRRR
ncbi:MAG: acyltransferase family protein, partial [Alphaproteobacteria bacterium]